MITILYLRAHYLNPSYAVLFEEFEKRSSAELRVIDASRSTIGEIRQALAKSDSLILSDLLIIASLRAGPVINSWTLVNRKDPSFYSCVLEMALAEARCPSLLVVYALDLHAENAMVYPWADKVTALAWAFEKKPVLMSDVPAAYRDPWMKRGADLRANWQRVIDKYPIRVELPFSLAANEFLGLPPRRFWDVCVAGASYATRRIAISSIQHQRLSLAPYRPVALSYHLLGTLGIDALAGVTHRMASLRNSFAQFSQRALVAHSNVNFVCGSGYRYPVRKFFEVAANRSALVAYPCIGFEDYGFVDGENALAAIPEDAGQASRRLVDDGGFRATLTTRAWNTVRKLHSAQERVNQLIACMKRLESGRLRGGQFIQGRFEIY